MIWIFIIEILICLISYCNEGQYRFKAEVKVYGESHIIGEPIMARVEVRNALGKEFEIDRAGGGNWFIEGKRCGTILPIDTIPAGPKGEENNQKKIRYKADWKEEYVYDLVDFCKIKKAGLYSIEYRYMLIDGKDLAKPVSIVIDIREPEGEDREAYKYFKGNIPLSGDKAHELLTHFPTSTYAGWVFGSPGYSIEWQTGKQIIENMLMSKERKEKEGVFVDEDKAMEFIKFSEKFLNANPDHVNAGLIYFKKAIAHMVLNQWDEAYEAGIKSLGYEWPLWYYSAYPPTREKQRKAIEEAIKEMEERGLVKKQK